MTHEPAYEPLLVGPAEAVRCILYELDIVGRIDIQEIGWLECDALEVATCELPAGGRALEDAQVTRVVEFAGWPAARNVEFTSSIEAAQSVETDTIQEKEQACSLCVANC